MHFISAIPEKSKVQAPLINGLVFILALLLPALSIVGDAGAQQKVVINEIMFAPISPEPEWIELLNTTSDTINIAGWVLTVQNHAPVTVPNTNTQIPPDSLIVLSSNDTELAAYRHVNIQRIVRCSVPDLKNS